MRTEGQTRLQILDNEDAERGQMERGQVVEARRDVPEAAGASAQFVIQNADPNGVRQVAAGRSARKRAGRRRCRSGSPP
jgi:hypothetical protein